jgi:predicted nuclease with RNAse H fold
MLTAGVDLAAEPKKTAVCVVQWTTDAATVIDVRLGADDDAVLRVCSKVDRAGIDCPFGWPEPFLTALTAHASAGPWPGRGHNGAAYRRELSFRATDAHVHKETGKWPLSVSGDKIGITTMRCAGLLDAMAARGEEVDRAGSGRVVEVYPAAALRRWSLWQTSHKGAEGRAVLGGIVDSLASALSALVIPPDFDRLIRHSDDAFDALICAFVARAAYIGLVDSPQTDEQRRRAITEGWIVLPRCLPSNLLPTSAE